MARRLRAEGIDEITLTHYADEASFRAMKLPEEGDDFEYRKLVNAEFAKVMVAHGLQLKVQVLDAKEYFEWLGVRQNTYQAQQEYPGGQHVSGDQAMTSAWNQVAIWVVVSGSVQRGLTPWSRKAQAFRSPDNRRAAFVSGMVRLTI